MLEEIEKLIVNTARISNRILDSLQRNPDYHMSEDMTKFICSLPPLVEQYVNLKIALKED